MNLAETDENIWGVIVIITLSLLMGIGIGRISKICSCASNVPLEATYYIPISQPQAKPEITISNANMQIPPDNSYSILVNDNDIYLTKYVCNGTIQINNETIHLPPCEAPSPAPVYITVPSNCSPPNIQAGAFCLSSNYTTTLVNSSTNVIPVTTTAITGQTINNTLGTGQATFYPSDNVISPGDCVTTTGNTFKGYCN